MVLDNKENRQEYRLLILPGGRVFSAETMAKIREFYENGGKVLATSMLPVRSSEFGKDELLKKEVDAVFGSDRRSGVVRTNAKGGQALFVPMSDAGSLSGAFAQLNVLPDVDAGQIELRKEVGGGSFVYSSKMTASGDDEAAGNQKPETSGGSFCYIHKQKNGKEIYFFSNSTDDACTAPVRLRGRMMLQSWNPYTGAVRDLESETEERDGQVYTRFVLDMPAVYGTFVVGYPVEVCR